MKTVQHKDKVDVFSKWVATHSSRNGNFEGFWPQICYDWTSEAPIHVVFEKKNEDFIWPWNGQAPLSVAYTNIDFSGPVPVLADGTPWDYNNWHRTALNGALSAPCTRVPTSFWDWRLQVKPTGNLTCDLDLLYRRTDTSQWVGIEATEIWFVDEDENNLSRDCYQHVHNLIHLRKNFNFRALRAQNKFMSAIGGNHFLVLHQNEPDKSSLVQEKVMVLELDLRVISLLEHRTSSRWAVKESLGSYFERSDLGDLIE